MRRVVERAVLVLVVVVGSLALVHPVGAQTPGGPPPTGPNGSPLPPPSSQGGPSSTSVDDPATTPATQGVDLTADDSEQVDEAATVATTVAAEMVTILHELGVGTDVPPPLEAVFEVVEEEWSFSEYEDEELVAQLVLLEGEAESLLTELVAEGIQPSPEVNDVLGGLTDQEWDAVDAGTPASVVLGPYLVAIDDLANRNGRAPATEGPRRIEDASIAAAVRGAYLNLDAAEDPEPTTTTVAPEVVPADEPVPVGTDEGDVTPWLLWLLAGLVVLAVGVGWWLAVRRRRRPPTVAGAQFDELLDVSRRLAAARTPADVERIGAEEAARLLGGLDGTTGAVVHRGPGGLELGHETRDGVLVPDRLGDGLLLRVVETGQPVSSVVDTEPAVRHLPAALVAVPVIGDGRVNGIALAVRNPDEPFTASEVELLRKLGPITAAAMESARHADDATSASLTDPLTGVGNRRRLEQDLPALLLGATGPTAVVMVDLDRFKAVNDEHGHPAGDRLLAQVAEALRGVLRPGDGVYRYGGEEFAMVLGGAATDEAVVVAERAREALRTAAFDLGDGASHRATASFGVAATAGPEDLDGLGLIAAADRALYQAKERGRDRVEVAPAEA